MAQRRELELERVVFFSDAVIAIAITLLVVDLRLPEALQPPAAAEAFLDLAPSFAAFVISFAVIGNYWVAHHRMFRYIEAWDGRLLAINLLFLFFIAVQPATTAALGRHGDLVLPTVAYAIAMCAMGLASTGIWLSATRARLVDERISSRQSRFLALRGALVPGFFAASIPIAVVSPTAAEVFWVFILPAQWALARAFHVEMPLAAGERRAAN